MSEDIAAIAREVADGADIEDACIRILGRPTSRTRNEVRYGRKGSLSIVTDGPKAGAWYDHESGQGGYLQARQRSPDRPISRPPRPAPLPAPDTRTREARAYWGEAHSLTGTLADTYLRHHRGIPAEAVERLAELDLCRFHPNLNPGDNAFRRAILIPATDAAGDLAALQRVELLPSGAKHAKISTGALAGAAWRLPGTGALVLAEGPEDALSVWSATGRPTWAALGGMARLLETIPAGTEVTIAAQRKDAPDSPAAVALMRAIEAAAGRGVLVEVTSPPEGHGDANDLLRAEGIDAVKAMLEAPPAPPPAPPTNVEEVRGLVRSAIATAIDSARQHKANLQKHEHIKTLLESGRNPRDVFPDLHPRGNLLGQVEPLPDCYVVRADTGVGKSAMLRAAIAEWLSKDRFSKIAIAVPTTALAEAAAEEARKAGLRAIAVRGRTARVPFEQLRDGEDPIDTTMCDDDEALSDALNAVIGVQKSVCKRGSKECDHFRECRYQSQMVEAWGADVIYFSHNYLFFEPFEFIDKATMLVIDESFYQAGLDGWNRNEGNNTSKLYLPVTSLMKVWSVYTSEGIDNYTTNDIHAANVKLAKAIEGNGNGWLSSESLTAQGIDEAFALKMAGLSNRLRINPGIKPGMDPNIRRRSRDNVEMQNKFARTLVNLWQCVFEMYYSGNDATGNVYCEGVQKDDFGAEIQGARIVYRKAIHKGWDTTTLILDATARMELIRPFYSWAKFIDTPMVSTPYVTTTHIVGAPVSGEKGRNPNNRKRLLDAAKIKGKGAKKVLLVTQKEVAEGFRERGLPDGWESIHFNMSIGLDHWGDVEQLQSWGRTMPPSEAAERMAAGLTGLPVPTKKEWSYLSVPHIVEGLDGSRAQINVQRHPHPVAEAIRWRVCEGELLQAVGRGRGVNRTRHSPLEIVIAVNDVTPPFPVHRIERWKGDGDQPGAKPTRIALAAQDGAILESPADLSRCWPKLWLTEVAAKRDRTREDGTKTLIGNSYKGFGPVLTDWTAVKYRLEGKGQKPKRAWFDLSVIDDPRAWLVERLGPLAVCEVGE